MSHLLNPGPDRIGSWKAWVENLLVHVVCNSPTLWDFYVNRFLSQDSRSTPTTKAPELCVVRQDDSLRIKSNLRKILLLELGQQIRSLLLEFSPLILYFRHQFA